MKPSKQYIASVDAGNGTTNAYLQKSAAAKPHYFSMPSLRVAVTGSEALGLDFEDTVSYVEWEGKRYAVGDDVLQSRDTARTQMSESRYGSNFHKFLVTTALAHAGAPSGSEISLSLFAPPSMVRNVRPAIVEAFNDQNMSITLSSDGQERKFMYTSVNVLPEGIGAAMAILLDPGGAVTSDGQVALAGSVLFLDFGQYTVDAILLENGRFTADDLESASFEQEGVFYKVTQPVLKALQRQDREFKKTTAADVDAVIRHGFMSGSFALSAGASSVDLKELIDEARTEWAHDIASMVVNNELGGIEGVKSLVLIGGGALLVADVFRGLYGDKVFDHSKLKHTKDIHPVDMNAMGGLRLAKMRIKGD